MANTVSPHTHTHADGTTHSHTHTHSHENKKAVLNRMSRIIGHMQSVKNMVEDDRDCSDVLIQLSAINSAVQSVSRVILKEHLSTCIIDAVKEGDYESVEELNNAIDKFMR
ncbi:MAG: metal-sensing transcriptional repressor [Clostridiales bacterium]|nr:metal-sensing transcriptional repressor [Candidatus Crickella equi]